MNETTTTHTLDQCERAIGLGFLISGDRQDGERATCPGCGQVFVHVCDEADGCRWLLVETARRVGLA